MSRSQLNTDGTKRRLFDTQAIVLVVDDEELSRTVTSAILRKQGYFVMTAIDGRAALDISRRFPYPIHVLLTDIVMPNMDGLELRRHFIEERPATKILLMSAYSGPCNGSILRKPFNLADLRDRIEQLLREPEAERKTESDLMVEDVS